MSDTTDQIRTSTDDFGISTSNVPFAVNRLTYRQYIDAFNNTSVDPATNEIIGPIDPGLPSLSAGEFYMTADETLNPDFQLSDYIARVEFYEIISSMINFRGVTHDAGWAAKLSSYSDLSTADSPSDLYVYFDAANPTHRNPDAPYISAQHGDVVFFGGTGREFMYTKNIDEIPPNQADVKGYWSEIGNDWMLSVIQGTVSAAVATISNDIDSISG